MQKNVNKRVKHPELTLSSFCDRFPQQVFGLIKYFQFFSCDSLELKCTAGNRGVCFPTKSFSIAVTSCRLTSPLWCFG